MKTTPTLLLAASTLALLISLTGCGKDKPEPQEEAGPQSAQGAMLESVRETVDAANARSRQVEEAADAATE